MITLSLDIFIGLMLRCHVLLGATLHAPLDPRFRRYHQLWQTSGIQRIDLGSARFRLHFAIAFETKNTCLLRCKVLPGNRISPQIYARCMLFSKNILQTKTEGMLVARSHVLDSHRRHQCLLGNVEK